MSKRASYVLLALIMAISVCVYGFFTWLKEGYHCDEIYSYGLSNTTFHYDMFEEDGSLRWNTAEDMDEYMVVPEGGGFDYGTVFKNQEDDVHPPLFYIFLHTFSSFTPGEYSMYPPIIMNIIFTLGAGLFLYLIALRVFKKSSLALLTVAAYMLSITCINMTIFIRMYAMLIFFTVAIAYIHIRIMENEYKMSWGEAISLALLTFLGSFTQYYFFLFLLPLAGFVFADMLLHGKGKECIRYVGVMIFTAVAYIAVWSPVFKHLISSDRGTEAFGNLASSSFFHNLWKFLKVFRQGIGPVFSCIIVAALVAFIIVFFRKRKTSASYFKENKAYMLLFVATAVYLLIVCKIAPYQTDRYIAMISPFVCITAIVSLKFLLKLFTKVKPLGEKTVSIITVIAVVAGILWSAVAYYFFAGFHRWESSYIYHFTDKYESVLNEHKGKKCLLIGFHEAHLLWCFRDYEYYDGTAFVDRDNLALLSGENRLRDEDEFMLYINDEIDNQEELIEKTKEILGFENHELVLKYNLRNIATVYRVYRN